MGKRRIAIEKIEKREARNVTFCKRRQGLFKKASTLSSLCDTHIGIIVFSPSAKDNVYCFSNPSIDTIIDRFYNNNNHNHNSVSVSGLIASNTSVSVSVSGLEDKDQDSNKKKMEEAEKQGGLLWWDNLDLSKFDSLEKLQRLETDLQDVKQKVVNQLEKINNGSSSAAAASALVVVGKTEEEEEGSEWVWPEYEDLETLLNNYDSSYYQEASSSNCKQEEFDEQEFFNIEEFINFD